MAVTTLKALIPEEMVHLTSNLNPVSMWKCSNTDQLLEDFGEPERIGFVLSRSQHRSFISTGFIFRIIPFGTLGFTRLQISKKGYPKSMKGLAELRVLDMKSTAVEELPDDFGDLHQLVELSLLNLQLLH
jgi:hypothetical protein